MKIQPTENRLLVRMNNIDPKAGLILPDGVDNNPHAEVLAVGPTVKTTKVGAKCLILPNALTIGLEHDNEKVFIINETSILAYLEDEE